MFELLYVITDAAAAQDLLAQTVLVNIIKGDDESLGPARAMLIEALAAHRARHPGYRWLDGRSEAIVEGLSRAHFPAFMGEVEATADDIAHDRV